MAIGFRSLVSGRAGSTRQASTRSTAAAPKGGFAGASKGYGTRNALTDRTNAQVGRNASRYSRYSKASAPPTSTAPMAGVTRSRAGRVAGRAASSRTLAAQAFVPPVVPMRESELPAPLEDIDVDFDDAQACTEYAEDIMNHFFKMEMPYMPEPDYMSKQEDVTPKMRGILLDWLIDVSLRFKQSQETMYLTTNVLDRFLTKYPIRRAKLQLVGITSMLIASKVSEIYPPLVKDFRYMCEHAYTRDEILAMEQLILAELDFAMQPPFPLHFLRRFSKAADSDLATHTTAKYLVELTIPDYQCVSYLPSSVAAAAMCLALKMNRSGSWNATMEHYTRYTEADLLPIMRHINDIHAGAATSKLKAVWKKYSKKKLLSVSLIPAVHV